MAKSKLEKDIESILTKGTGRKSTQGRGRPSKNPYARDTKVVIDKDIFLDELPSNVRKGPRGRQKSVEKVYARVGGQVVEVRLPEPGKRRGRPPGSKNRPKVGVVDPAPKRRGRPPGSKNKSKASAPGRKTSKEIPVTLRGLITFNPRGK